MSCPECGQENPAGNRFCGQCGARLTPAAAPPAPAAPTVAAAPEAGAQPVAALSSLPAPGPAISAFAPTLAPMPATRPEAEVGRVRSPGLTEAALPAAEAAPSAARATPVDDVSEGRRQVAILFCDLTGFTELSTRLDPEDLHELVQAYFDRTEAIVTALGGTLERYIGDAVMAVFGARRAHDDDALRAVRAGLDIHAAMPGLSRRFGLSLSSVVGIATGEVVVKAPRPGYAAEVAIVGVSVNLAARIESLGAPGELLVADELHAMVRSRVVSTSIGRKTLKGIDRAVEVFKVERIVDADVSARSRFVGREAERGRLRACIARVGDEGRPASMLIRGEAGIGKSRLLGELDSIAASAGWTTRSARFVDFGLRRGAEGMQALACALLGLDPIGADEVSRRAAAEAAVAAGAVDETALPLLYEWLSAPQTPRSRTAFDAMDAAQRERHRRAAIAGLIAAEARRAPLLLVFEDMHWADAIEIERLAELAASLARPTRAASGLAVGAAVVATTESLPKSRSRERLPLLIALSSRPTDARIEPAWSAAGAAIEILDLVALDATALAELAGSLSAIDTTAIAPAALAGCIARSGGNPLFLEQLVRHVAESGGNSVPASIRSLLLARMDLLPRHDRELLQVASVLGQRFERDALAALMREGGHGDADGNFEGLLRAQMLVAQGGDLFFAHALIHEAAYASLLRRSARDLHLLAAEWFKGRDALLHASHLDRADSPDAAAAYGACAETDMAAGRHREARAALDRGLAIAAEAGIRVELSLSLARLLHDTGAVAESRATYDLALADAVDDGQRARAWIGRAACMRLSDDIDGALAALATAEPLASGRDADLARLHYLRGSLAFPRGDIAACRQEHGLALRHARAAGQRVLEAEALSGLGDAAYAGGRMKSAWQSFDECMRICGEIGLGRVEAANRFMVATVRIYLNEFEPALRDALDSADLARRVGHQRAEIVSCLTAGWILILLGRLDEARAITARGLAVTEALRAARFKPFLMESVARIEWAEGRSEAARATIAEALNLARDGQLMRFIGPWILATHALCAADAEAREVALAEGRELLAQGCVGHNTLNFHAIAIESAAAWGDAATIDASASALAEYMRDEPHPWGEFQIARARALAAAIRRDGDAAATRERLLQVLAQARALGWQAAAPALEHALAALGRE